MSDGVVINPEVEHVLKELLRALKGSGLRFVVLVPRAQPEDGPLFCFGTMQHEEMINCMHKYIEEQTDKIYSA